MVDNFSLPLCLSSHEFEEEVTEQVQEKNKKIVNDPGGKGKNLWEIPIFENVLRVVSENVVSGINDGTVK